MDTRNPEFHPHDEPRHIHIPRPSRRLSTGDPNALFEATSVWAQNPPATDRDTDTEAAA